MRLDGILLGVSMSSLSMGHSASYTGANLWLQICLYHGPNDDPGAGPGVVYVERECYQ